jgi:hypothetical protein
MMGGACFARSMKTKHSNYALYYTLILVIGLTFQVTLAWGGMEYELIPNDKMEPWNAMSYETFIDGDETNCSHVDCVDYDGDENIPTVVEGQKFKVDIDCSHGDEEVNWSDDFTYGIESTKYGDQPTVAL